VDAIRSQAEITSRSHKGLKQHALKTTIETMLFTLRRYGGFRDGSRRVIQHQLGGFMVGMRNWVAGIGLLTFGIMAGGPASPAAAQAMKDVTRIIAAFGKSCVQPEINMETFGKELWQARGLIVVDILAADGPGESLLGFVFDTDMERFRATFPEFAKPQTFTLKKGWTAVRSADLTRFAKGNMEGSPIPRPILMCRATLK
jgi:hypothetical protein